MSHYPRRRTCDSWRLKENLGLITLGRESASHHPGGATVYHNFRRSSGVSFTRKKELCLVILGEEWLCLITVGWESVFHNPQWRRCISSRTKEKQWLITTEWECVSSSSVVGLHGSSLKEVACVLLLPWKKLSHYLRKRDCVSSTLNESLCLIILLWSLSLSIFGRGSVYHHHRRRFCVSILWLKSLCLIYFVQESVSHNH